MSKETSAVCSHNLIKYNKKRLLLEITGKILRLGSGFIYALKSFPNLIFQS